MYAPTACTTPTRLPTLWWSLAVALLLLSVFAPALATEAPQHDAAITGTVSEAGGWRVLSADQLMRAALLRRADPAHAGMLPLAVLPSQRSALWLGVSASRASGARVELRWTVPLDGGAPNLGALGS